MSTVSKAGVVAVLAALALAAPSSGGNVENFGFPGPVHWSDHGGTLAVMWFIDHTGSAWPVLASASEWNKAPDIHITYAFGTAENCPRHCVDVRTVTDLGPCAGSSIVYGQTPPDFTANGHLTGNTRIEFNRNCNSGLTDGGRRELVCHETGHAAGWIGHRAFGCMRPGDIVSPYKKFPSDHDFAMFNSPLYDHND